MAKITRERRIHWHQELKAPLAAHVCSEVGFGPRLDFRIEDQGVSTISGARRRGIRSPLSAWLAALAVLAVIAAGVIGLQTNSGQWSEASGWSHHLASSVLTDSESPDGRHNISNDRAAAADVIAPALPGNSAHPGHCPRGEGQQANCSTGIAPGVVTESVSDRPAFSLAFIVARPPAAAADTSTTQTHPVSLVQLSTRRI